MKGYAAGVFDIFFCLVCFTFYSECQQFVVLRDNSKVEYKGLIKGSRNAIYLLDEKNVRHLFPDFYTFITLGFNVSDTKKIDDKKLENMAEGLIVKSLPAPPPFRPDDSMYHELCDDPVRMIDTLNLIPNLGHFKRHINKLQIIKETKSLEILALGGSITAGGYFLEFARLLQVEHHLNVTYHNHGHGATGIPYTLYCVDFEKYKPDLVLIDFAVNDYGHPKLMDTLLRKVFEFDSDPIVVLVNLWVHQICPTPRYLLHSFYYNIPMINICPAANLCYGKRLPRHITEQYSTTDGVHPWGSKGVWFIGQIMNAWWMRYFNLLSTEDAITSSIDMSDHLQSSSNWTLPSPLFHVNAVGTCTRCDALVDDADAKLTPIEKRGFHVVTRAKTGFGGFDGNSSTKSFKRSWQSDFPGSRITFKFYGSSVAVALWQRRDGMGVLYATIDGNEKDIAKASGFFRGFTWAMERNNTGRNEIITLFEGLEDKEHTITFTVSDEPANVWVKGHLTQIFALLSSSSNKNCKSIQV